MPIHARLPSADSTAPCGLAHHLPQGTIAGTQMMRVKTHLHPLCRAVVRLRLQQGLGACHPPGPGPTRLVEPYPAHHTRIVALLLWKVTRWRTEFHSVGQYRQKYRDEIADPSPGHRQQDAAPSERYRALEEQRQASGCSGDDEVLPEHQLRLLTRPLASGEPGHLMSRMQVAPPQP